MPLYILSEAAQTDIEEIVEYIFRDDPSAALAFEDKIYHALGLIGENPLIGHKRPDLTEREVRFWTFRKPYMIVYAEGYPVRIFRIINGYRDIETLLNG